MAWRDPWENVDRANALRMQSDAQGINMLSALQGAQTNALQQQSMTAKMAEEARLRDRQQRIEQALIGAGGDMEKAIPAITQFAPLDALKMKKDAETAALEADSKKATTAKARADALKSVHDISKQSFGGVMQTPTPEAAMAAINQVQTTLKSLGLPGDLTPEIQKVQAFRTPDEIRQWAAGNAMAADKLLPQFQTRNNGGTTDTLSINPVTGKVDVANSIRNTVSPDAALSASVSRENSIRADNRQREFNTITQTGNVAKNETDLRKEFDNLAEVKNYKQAMPAYTAIVDAAKRNTPQSDINLVYGIAKLYDPTSVVREGEYATVANSPNIPERIKGYAQYIAGGGKLSPETKRQIVAEASSRIGSYENEFGKARASFETIAKERGLNPGFVIPAMGRAPRGGEAMPPPPEAPQVPGRSQSGKIGNVDPVEALVRKYSGGG